MKKYSGIILFLISYSFLAAGGIILFSLISPFVHEHFGGRAKLLFGAALAASGGLLLAQGFHLSEQKRIEPVSPARVAAAGLLLPGAAQAYSGRWLAAGCFYLLPWVVMPLCLALVRGIHHASQTFPFLRFAGWPFERLMHHPRMGVFIPCWIASILEGYWWVNSPPTYFPLSDAPRWRGPAVAIGLALFSFLYLTFLESVVSGGVAFAGCAVREFLGLR